MWLNSKLEALTVYTIDTIGFWKKNQCFLVDVTAFQIAVSWIAMFFLHMPKNHIIHAHYEFLPTKAHSDLCLGFPRLNRWNNRTPNSRSLEGSLH